jgi:hypothetical protein
MSERPDNQLQDEARFAAKEKDMSKFALCIVLAAVAAAVLLTGAASPVQAQGPTVVTAYYPPQPVVGYRPELRGLLFPRVVYRPTWSYVAPAMATVTAPPFGSASVQTTTYYAPAPTVVPAPVTTYYAPAPTVLPAPVTTYYAPPHVRTYIAPAPVILPPPVTVRYAPIPVVPYYFGP